MQCATSPHKAPAKWFITSLGDHDGKIVLAQNLAIALAHQTSCPVMLIDANLSQPPTHNNVAKPRNTETQMGLSDYLLQKAEIDNIVQKTHISNLHVISAGRCPRLSPEVFSDRLRQLVTWCQNNRFHIIMIGPPLSSTDTAFMARQLENTVITIRPGITYREEIVAAAKQLKNRKVNILGIVFYQLVPEKRMVEFIKTTLKELPMTSDSLAKRTVAPRKKHLWNLFGRLGSHEKDDSSPAQRLPNDRLLDCQRENLRLQAQLRRLQNERKILVNSARFFSKFAEAAQGNPRMKGTSHLMYQSLSETGHGELPSSKQR